MEAFEELVQGWLCQVKLDGRLSDCFPVSKGVRQLGMGLIANLIPSCYGPSSERSSNSSVGLSISSFYAGVPSMPVTYELSSPFAPPIDHYPNTSPVLPNIF